MSYFEFEKLVGNTVELDPFIQDYNEYAVAAEREIELYIKQGDTKDTRYALAQYAGHYHVFCEYFHIHMEHIRIVRDLNLAPLIDCVKRATSTNDLFDIVDEVIDHLQEANLLWVNKHPR